MEPFSYTNYPIKDVVIVLEATGFTSVTGQQYILLFHEALYMPELDHTLINTNQLRQFHTQVQENPYHPTEPMIFPIQAEIYTVLRISGGNIYYSTPGFQLRQN